ncbi:SUKH-4 family immunity protein [Actinoplanes couchii]|uniref:SUKH-4 immunity protein n=1 Tax=Actinoplanes couchii TaxID=403638 RepID=A0ABQ3WZZ7_9ACTN|nr:SUKH-4 family immunity protein [Actinoplanes couchii]MDR6316239.1 hypothetical protein [Actinoplanes couchii]GID51853.1 hypothetical protein Aco03nite_002570 [Actinoplanes couchii]
MASEWLPYRESAVRRAGLEQRAASALTGSGLPVNARRMFVRDSARELETRELDGCGSAAFLGQYEDGVNTYWVSVRDGSVWMLFGYDDVPQRAARINTSVPALQALLTLWDEFIGSGVHEDDDAYEGLVEDVLRRARQADPVMFDDEDSWWSRVFEEVELGVLGPE